MDGFSVLPSLHSLLCTFFSACPFDLFFSIRFSWFVGNSMDLSETRDALTLLIGVGFVLIALLAFIGFARPQLQKLAKNTIWQVPQMGLKGLIGLLLFVQLCMVFAESLSYPESKTAFLPYILGYVVVCPILTKLIHVALKQPAATNRYVATLSDITASVVWQLGILFLVPVCYELVETASHMHIIH